MFRRSRLRWITKIDLGLCVENNGLTISIASSCDEVKWFPSRHSWNIIPCLSAIHSSIFQCSYTEKKGEPSGIGHGNFIQRAVFHGKSAQHGRASWYKNRRHDRAEQTQQLYRQPQASPPNYLAMSSNALTSPNATRPAFPAGKQVPVAPLSTIDLTKLISRDATEVTRLLDACVTHGFFYLDLQTSIQGRQIVADEQGLLLFMKNYFEQSHEKKMLDDRKVHTHGCASQLWSRVIFSPLYRFKPVGTFSGTEEGSRDCYETLKVSLYTHFVSYDSPDFCGGIGGSR